MEQKLKDAIETLVAALSEDKSEGSYYYSWQANIAMAFQDTYWEFAQRHVPTAHEIHKVSNEAAKRFLDQLCHIPASPNTDTK